MSSNLEDEDRQAGTLLSASGDGSAVRYDKVKLAPAAKNAWYVMATVAGEQDSELHFESPLQRHARNRRFWNGWMCQDMDSTARELLAARLDLPKSEFDPLDQTELEQVYDRFEAAFPGGLGTNRIPKPGEAIDMSGVYFRYPLFAAQLYFGGDVNFTNVHFAGEVDFSRAYFAGDVKLDNSFINGKAVFESSHFEDRAFFRRAHFSNDVTFERTHFARNAYFSEMGSRGDSRFYESHFCGDALFSRARFTGLVDFNGVHFQKLASFSDARFAQGGWFAAAKFDFFAIFNNAHFCKFADFQRAQFSGLTIFSLSIFDDHTTFKSAHFKARAPEFYHCKMHQNTAFSESRKLWPMVTPKTAENNKRAYTRLRQIAAEIYDPDLEHFFLRQEMYCKESMVDGIDRVFFTSYRIVSDYGISVARPVVGLALVSALGWGIIGSFLRASDQAVGGGAVWQGLGVSLGNTLPFLGLVSKMRPDFYEKAPAWLDALSALQSVAGIVLLFFLGLGLSNRFRLK